MPRIREGASERRIDQVRAYQANFKMHGRRVTVRSEPVALTVAPRSVRERPFTPTQSDAKRRSPLAFVT